VVEDCQHVFTILSEMDAEAAKTSMVDDGFPANHFNVHPFIFYYLGS
jgi:hypothetical protein